MSHLINRTINHIIPIILFLVLLLLSCGPGAGGITGGDDDETGFLGSTLTITNALVYPGVNNDPPYAGLHARLTKVNDNTRGIQTLVPITGMVNVISEGTINSGKFSVTLGKPKPPALQTLEAMFEGDADMVISDPGVKAYRITTWGILLTNDKEASLSHQNKTGIEFQPGYYRYFSVQYWYVEKDVTITGSRVVPASAPPYTTRYNVTLKAGWNTVLAVDAHANGSGLTYVLSNKAPSAGGQLWRYNGTVYGDLPPQGFLGETLTVTNAVVYKTLYEPYTNLNSQTDPAGGSVVNGVFNVTHTGAPGALRGLQQVLGIYGGGVSISNYSAGVYALPGWGVTIPNSELPPGAGSAGIVCAAYDMTTQTATMVEYWYADRKVTINGSYSSSVSGVTYGYAYNITLLKGWNTILVKRVIVEGENNSYMTSYTNGAPTAGYMWGMMYGSGGGGAGDISAPDAPVILGETLTINNAEVYEGLGSMPGDELDPLISAALTHVNGQLIETQVEVIEPGTISGGKFNAKLGAPKTLGPLLLLEGVEGEGLTIPAGGTYMIDSWDVTGDGETIVPLTDRNGYSGIYLYIYVDSDVYLHGNGERPANPDTQTTALRVSVWELSLKKGWNKVRAEIWMDGETQSMNLSSGSWAIYSGQWTFN